VKIGELSANSREIGDVRKLGKAFAVAFLRDAAVLSVRLLTEVS
jgi:4-aminobutyrate aminotransferase-like enzyme